MAQIWYWPMASWKRELPVFHIRQFEKCWPRVINQPHSTNQVYLSPQLPKKIQDKKAIQLLQDEQHTGYSMQNI